MDKALMVKLTPTNNNIMVRSQHGQSADGKADPNKQQYYSEIPAWTKP